MRPKLILAATAAAFCAAAPACAHHSFNMFALDKVVTVPATIKSVSWRMPHVWVYAVTGGEAEEWAFEGHAPNLMTRKGWKSSTLKPGDKISITMHPMKDGSKSGSLIYVTMAGGQVIWNADSLNNP